MEDEGFLDMSQEILVKETQDDFPATFSKNIIKKLGICQTKRGAEAVTTNNNQINGAVLYKYMQQQSEQQSLNSLSNQLGRVLHQ